MGCLDEIDHIDVSGVCGVIISFWSKKKEELKFSQIESNYVLSLLN